MCKYEQNKVRGCLPCDITCWSFLIKGGSTQKRKKEVRAASWGSLPDWRHVLVSENIGGPAAWWRDMGVTDWAVSGNQAQVWPTRGGGGAAACKAELTSVGQVATFSKPQNHRVIKEKKTNKQTGSLTLTHSVCPLFFFFISLIYCLYNSEFTLLCHVYCNIPIIQHQILHIRIYSISVNSILNIWKTHGLSHTSTYDALRLYCTGQTGVQNEADDLAKMVTIFLNSASRC